MKNTLLPQNCGRSAFYVYTRDMRFRVYKVKYGFSTVGEAFLFEFCVSFRHLLKWKHFCRKLGMDSQKEICLDCSADVGNKLLNDLRRKGSCDLSKWY